jgi:hypothetical protein
MRHFSSEEWADFVRKVLEQKQKLMMQGHLDKGCATCSKALAGWVHVRDMAVRERECQPPESAVRTVKGLLAIHGKSRRTGVAALLFDNLMTPAVVGVRSAAGAARQILYGFDNYRIDLRLERNADSDAICLVGQIVGSGKPAASMGRTAVALLRGRKILSTSRTNEFGEFHLECEPAGSLRLQFVLPEGKIFRTPTIDFSGATEVTTGDSTSTDSDTRQV